jgi:hypothetical protein
VKMRSRACNPGRRTGRNTLITAVTSLNGSADKVPSTVFLKWLSCGSHQIFPVWIACRWRCVSMIFSDDSKTRLLHTSESMYAVPV